MILRYYVAPCEDAPAPAGSGTANTPRKSIVRIFAPCSAHVHQFVGADKGEIKHTSVDLKQ